MAPPVFSLRRSAGTIGTVALAATAALLFRFSPLDALQAKATVRGNVPGEWRYWGADAWSTRYSPLDQINASNFSTLTKAWQWNG